MWHSGSFGEAGAHARLLDASPHLSDPREALLIQVDALRLAAQTHVSEGHEDRSLQR